MAGAISAIQSLQREVGILIISDDVLTGRDLQPEKAL